MKAIIMAGGEGSRLRPLTCDRPKPMVPIMDRPIMEYIVELLKKHNFYHIGVTLMYQPEAIREHFQDGTGFNVNMRYFIEETPLGTAGSVKNAEGFLDEPFIVISGDALTDFNLSEIIEYHRQKQAAVTIVLTRVPNPLEYGVVITDKEGRIRQFLEKPSWGEVFSDTVNTGIYVIQPEILRLIPPATKFDFSKDLFPMLLEKGYPMFGCVMPGYWCDIGDLNQYRQAHYDILAGQADVRITGTQITPGIWVGEGTLIHPEANLEAPLYLGNNVKVGKDAQLGSYSVIGSNSILDDEASLKRSILWNNVYVGKKATLRGTTVGNRVKIKVHSALYEGAVIGDGSVLDDYSSVKPGVKVWPHKLLEKGTVLNESLIWGTKTSKNLFGNAGIIGNVNVEMTPEIASKIGAAYGSVVPRPAQIVLGADNFGSTQMIKNALNIGLQSVGINVLDIGNTVRPVSRYAVRALGVNAGIHVGTPDQGENVVISFFNARGANINKGDERKIENAFWREDFQRIEGRRVEPHTSFPDINGLYLEELLKSADQAAIRRSRLKLLVDYEKNTMGELIAQLLDKLGCQFEVRPRDEMDKDPWDELAQQAHKVVTGGYHLGVAISPDGEQIVLIDDRGLVIRDDLFTALVSLLVLSSHPTGTVVVPVTAPKVIDEIAARYKGKVIRTKTGTQFIMEKILEEQVSGSPGAIKQFTMQFDAISALVIILDYLAKHQVSLSRLMEKIPRFHTTRKTVACPWDAKGRVMRRLIEEQVPGTELLDGVKVFHNDGWALVLPDSEEPVVRIFSEGADMEMAEELSAMYTKKINAFKKGK